MATTSTQQPQQAPRPARSAGPPPSGRRRTGLKGRTVALLGVVALLVALLGTVVAPGPAGAHTDLLQGSPGPGQEAGGTIDFVDLAFLGAVRDAVVEVSLDGAVLPGATTVTDGVIIRHQLIEPLSTPGRYQVAYTITSADGDRHTETYQFTYDPASAQAFRLGGTSEAQTSADDGIGAPRLIAFVVFFGALAGLAFIYLRSLEQRRSRVAAPDDQVPGR